MRQRYPSYTDSGINWIGEIPSLWKSSRIKWIARLTMGQSPASDDCNFEEVGLPFLQGCGEFAKQYPSPRQFCEAPPRTVTTGSILLSVRAPVGAMNMADQPYGIGRGLCGILAVHCECSFLWYAIIAARHQLDSVATGSTYAAVSVEDVANVNLPVPSLDEQGAIAAFLDRETGKIDALVEEQRRLIALLKEKRQATISHAVTKGLDPDVPMKPSGIDWLGDIPEHWDIAQLRRLVDPRRRVTYGIVQPGQIDPEGRLMVRGQDYSFGWADPSTIFRVSPEIEEPYRRARLRAGDIVMTIVGAGTGNTEVVPSFIEGANITQTTARIAPHDDHITGEFLKHALQSESGQRQVAIYQKGAAQPGLNLEHLVSFRVPVPPLEEQFRIAQWLDPETARFDTLISEAEMAIDLLQERRSALISAAVTGKIDVRGEAVQDHGEQSLEAIEASVGT